MHSRSLSSNSNSSSSSPSSRLSSMNKVMSMSNKSKPPSTFHSKKFDVDQFKSSEFSTTLFIDNITKGLVEEQASGGEDFEATAFKKLLDDNLEFLQEFATETDSDIQALSEQCMAAEKTFQMQMADLSQTFETNFSKFSKLDARINRVGSSAARIGDRLEVVDVQQSRAVEAVGCIKYFLELNNADSKRSQVFTDPNKVHELAHLIKKLSGVAQELDLQSLNKGKEATEIISNNIEIELLGQFDKAGAVKDYSKMKEYANTLVEFNGGDSCIQRYISTRDMFFKEDCIAKDQSMAIDTSKRRDVGDFLVDTRLDDFFKDIIDTVEQEDELIAKIFPSPPPVMSHLIQRIFEQRVRTFMELMLTLDQDNHSLYLRTLCLALEKTKDILVQSLKKYSSFGVDFGTLVNSVFCNYQDEYIEKEVAFLVGSFQHTLNELRSVEPVEIEDRERARISVLSTVTKFLSATEEAVARAKVLSPDDQPAQNVQRIFKSCLIKYLGYDYLDDLLNRACRLPPPADPKFLLSLQNFFTLVATITSAVLLIQRHFQLVTQPLVSASVNEYTQCYEALGEFMAGLETKISNGMSIAMQSLGACMEKLLAEQKKDDFKFKDEATEYSNDPTKVCQTCVKFIHNVYDTIIDALDGRNVEIFLEEFGLKIQKLLLAHFKKFKIGKGGLKLMRDLSEYKDALKLFQIPAVDEACEVLGEISKLHLIAPENLKTVIEEGVLSRMDISEVLEFVKLRNDYKSTWIGKYV